MEVDLSPLRKEFSVFWQSVTLRETYMKESAAVCVADLDKGDTTLTKIFHSRREPVEGGSRAHDVMLRWLGDDVTIKAASDVSLQIFLNYSPSAETATGMASLLGRMSEEKRSAKLSLKFAALRGVFEGEPDASANQDGLRKLKDAGAKIDVMFEEDWNLLTSLLVDKESQRKIRRVAGQDKRHIRWILRGGSDNDVVAYDDIAETEDSGASHNKPTTHDKFLE